MREVQISDCDRNIPAEIAKYGEIPKRNFELQIEEENAEISSDK